MTSRAVPDLDDWRRRERRGPCPSRPSIAPCSSPTTTTAASETLPPLAEAAGRAAHHARLPAKVKIQVTSGPGDTGVTHPLTHRFPLTSPSIVLFSQMVGRYARLWLSITPGPACLKQEK